MHTVKGFSIVNEAEVDVFLEFLCFFYDPTDVNNLILGSSAFSKFSLYLWKYVCIYMYKCVCVCIYVCIYIYNIFFSIMIYHKIFKKFLIEV